MGRLKRAAWSSAIVDQIHIDTPVERVWELTVDIDRWHEWLPTVSSGRVLDKSALSVGTRFALNQPMQPTKEWVVTELQPLRSACWETIHGAHGFAARHAMKPNRNGTSSILEIRFTQRGRVTDWLLGMILRSAIAAENKALKAASELPVPALP